MKRDETPEETFPTRIIRSAAGDRSSRVFAGCEQQQRPEHTSVRRAPQDRRQREYNDELNKLNAAEAQEIGAYAKDYDKITDKEAEDVVNKSLHLEAQHVELKKKYFEKMKSALSASVAAKFYEIDSQFQDIVHLQATSALPATP